MEFDKTTKALATALNFRQMRQKLITSNIANAETPGYKAKRLDFEEALARALDIEKQNSIRTQDKRHYNVGGGGFDNLQPEIYDESNGVVTPDGNTVDRDEEMAKLAENKILYDATVEVLNRKLALKKYLLSTER